MPTFKSTAPSTLPSPRHGGLDLLTLIGMVLVMAEHYLTLIEMPLMFPAGRPILGRVGVYLFLLMSGYHAAESHLPPWDWLIRRLTRIYPAFWLVLCVAFPAAWFSGAKPFDAWQVLAQFSGFGYYWYRQSLVLVPTWFLSPLLLCYLMVFLIRSTRFARSLAFAATIAMAVLAAQQQSAWICLPLLAFLIGYCLVTMFQPGRRAGGMVAISLLILIASPLNFSYFKVGISGLLLAAGLSYPRPIFPIQRLTRRSYEFYLVHGLAFYGAFRVLDLDPVLGGLLALLGSLVLAELLYQSVRRLQPVIRKFALPATAPASDSPRRFLTS